MQRDYLLLEATISLCPECLCRLDAKIVQARGRVYVSRCCPQHGPQFDLLEEDEQYFRIRNQFARPASVSRTQTESHSRCPFDCGLCSAHEQHTCIALIEIANGCDLQCPVCYAASERESALSIVDYGRMLDFAIESEGGDLDILQLSGGEPTTHPELVPMIALARRKGVKHVLLNTNGLNFLRRPDLVPALAQFQEGFEVYLQFDGVSDPAYEQLRGRPLLDQKLQVLELLSQAKVPVTLVMSVAAGVNDHEVGAVVVKALQTPYVRGVNLQPLAYFGRIPEDRCERLERATLSGIIRRLEAQMKQMIRQEHLVPLPCDVDRVAIGYFHKRADGSFTPMVTRRDVLANLHQVRNTLRFSPEEFVAAIPTSMCSGSTCCGGLGGMLAKYFSQSFFSANTTAERARLVSETTFRVSITSFVDAYNFDLRSCQRECVHVITPELRKIPFSAYNLYHRQQAGTT